MGKYQLTVEEKQQLDQQGYIVIPDVLSEEEINHYRPRILELAEIEQQNGRGLVHTDGKGQLVRWLVNKGQEFERLVAHPRVVPYFEYMLGSDYILSTLTSNTIRPGAKDGGYHLDYSLGQMPEPLPRFPIFANTLWLLDDFTPQNGGTRFVPASHLRLKKPPVGLESDPEEVRLNAPKGSVFLFNGAIWHSAGANRTNCERVALICFCGRSFMKPQFDFVHHLKPEVYERASPEMRRIYGFDSQPRKPDELY
jgi:ectoine hydroxylase-related dioxygenase (phytanoyl-CoA dioxygenase family)